VIRTEEEHLAHYGILRRSGRYPWGSGDTQSQRNKDFLSITKEQRKSGLSDAEIAKSHGMSVADLRATRSIAVARERQENQLTAQRLKEKGWSNVEIGRRMGAPESTVRTWLAPSESDKANVLRTTSKMLKEQVDKKEMIDIGIGAEKMVGVTRNRFDTAVSVLKEEGYKVHTIYQEQINIPGKFTKTKILSKPGITTEYVNKNRDKIGLIDDYSDDHGRSFLSTQPPISVNSRRIKVVYGDEGGAAADGMIYVRPGVKDLRIGENRYGQVRIMVDNTHYLKGMAVYKDDLPEGTDLVFNTKAANTGRKKDAMKPLETKDPDMPFGSIIRQVHGPDGKVVSAMNMVGSPTKEGSGEEGAWDKWSTNLSSQMLSKQSPKLARQQLDLTYDRRTRELNEIKSLTNPTVRKKLLMEFADQTDAASVHLAAAALPRTATKVLLPIPSMKPNEIYAPTFRDGERVVLIRHPHGGTFEIPELTVNNRNREGRKIIGTGEKGRSHDAVGIHHKVAEHLSGADFDGDTVLVIPNNRRSVEHTPALKELKGFDPQMYKIPKDSPIPRVSSATKQHQMGNVSNLITDMTLRGADTEELARAVRHSMVVIDSEKHQLDWKQSEKDHGILALKEEYQGGKRKGAATLISRAGSQKRIPQRQPRSAKRGGPIDPVTGKKVYEPTGRMRVETKREVDPVTGRVSRVPTGRTKPILEVHDRLAVTEDAFELSSGFPMETIYAEHSNRLKAMANGARKEALPLKGTGTSSSAKKTYHKEVASLDAKLNLAERNAPYERQAQRIAQTHLTLKRQANPGMDPADAKKVKQQALNVGRARTGAKKHKIIVTQSEWDAIQAGAISNHKLERILYNSDMDTVKRLALPKHAPKLTSAKLLRAQTMLDSGYTQAEVADALGIGLTTLKVGLNE
jgi:hypothetical protein